MPTTVDIAETTIIKAIIERIYITGVTIIRATRDTKDTSIIKAIMPTSDKTVIKVIV
jgi:hypothetical protein